MGIVSYLLDTHTFLSNAAPQCALNSFICHSELAKNPLTKTLRKLRVTR